MAQRYDENITQHKAKHTINRGDSENCDVPWGYCWSVPSQPVLWTSTDNGYVERHRSKVRQKMKADSKRRVESRARVYAPVIGITSSDSKGVISVGNSNKKKYSFPIELTNTAYALFKKQVVNKSSRDIIQGWDCSFRYNGSVRVTPMNFFKINISFEKLRSQLTVHLRKRVRLNVVNAQNAKLTFTFNKDQNTNVSLSLSDTHGRIQEEISTEEYNVGRCSLSLGFARISLSDFEIGLTCVSQGASGSIDIEDIELEVFGDTGYCTPVIDIDQPLYFQVGLPINRQGLIVCNVYNRFSVRLGEAQTIYKADKLFILNKKTLKRMTLQEARLRFLGGCYFQQDYCPLHQVFDPKDSVIVYDESAALLEEISTLF